MVADTVTLIAACYDDLTKYAKALRVEGEYTLSDAVEALQAVMAERLRRLKEDPK